MKIAMITTMTAGVSFAKRVLFMYYLWKIVKTIAIIALILFVVVMIRKAIKKNGIVIGRIVNKDDISGSYVETKNYKERG